MERIKPSDKRLGGYKMYGRSKKYPTLSYQQIDEKLKDIKVGKNITLFLNKYNVDNSNEKRIVKGYVTGIYKRFILVHIGKKKGYNECFLKTDLYHGIYSVK